VRVISLEIRYRNRLDDPPGGEGNETNWLEQVRVIFLEMRYRNRWMIYLEERVKKQTGQNKCRSSPWR
jgi:hypothetical protein